MMKTVLLNLFILTILLLEGCIQAPSNSRKSSTSSSTTTSSTSPTFASDELLYWYTTSKIQGTISVNKTSTTTYYLRGKYIHNYLSALDSNKVYNYTKYYCLVGSFSNTTSYKQLRFRAIPTSTTSSSKVTERMLRLDISNANDNITQCNYTTINSIANTSAVYALSSVCASSSSCSGKVTTTGMALFLANKSGTAFNSLSSIDTTALDTTGINMQIDLSSSSTTDSSACSNSSCSALGYDCCVEGQCVKDGTLKSSYTMSTFQAADAQAYAEYVANNLTFINYPNYFNICANISHSSTSTSTGTTSETELAKLTTAQDRINNYIKQWYCLSDVINEVSDPYSRCYGTTVNGTQTAYDEVRYSVAKACGCTASASELDTKCPNWSIKPIYKTSSTTNSIANKFLGYYDATNGLGGLTSTAARGNYYIISVGGTISSTSYVAGDWIIYDGANWFKFQNNISDFYCYTPTVTSISGSIKNLNVNVSARSAPHRFYDSGGINYDDITGLPTAITQESLSSDADFYYLDETNKSGPVSGAFNYKAVLGTMIVDLSKTAPAKMVTVDLGTTYIISATSGYFTPCPQCAKDNWFQSFFSRPVTQKGIGLYASGYSTTRDAYGNNDTLGNYEDTHFGRACYIPMTMIPLSHQKNSTLQTQRLNRLKTQSAYYINGYQKDWYGFNQGALIGSFDGVTWFAIGTGRRITSTSTKLFLAFNAPFLDLAAKTDTIVNIIPDTASNTAPNIDYNPDLSMKDPLQGTAATCQRYHQCSTDSECVAQLGWEYVCADVSQIKTSWPLFDSSGVELKNQEKISTLFDIISTTAYTDTTKRCVYRGSGAPCKKDTVNFTGNSTYKKLFTCAPNFYCASLDNNKFNSELVRTPNEFDNIYYGMDTNVLGRPLKYVTANSSLTSEIKSNISYNGVQALGMSDAASEMGMCQPGKYLNTALSATPENNVIKSHSNPDSLKRTDYISQIGSCSSSSIGLVRTLNCPAFGDDQNYLDVTVEPSVYAAEQNSCGGEARQTTTSYSAFSGIEFGTLATTSSITTQGFAADACLRRAGSVCHTDLDCSPSTLHESLAGGININYFGGTDAERSYWTESLICSQADSQPLKSASNYYDYKLSNNRCCREVGKDFTMYTAVQSGSTLVGSKYLAQILIPDQPTNSISLDTRKFSYLDTTATNRYSRYSSSPLAHDTSGTYGSSDLVPYITTSKEPTQKQWEVINETGELTCCGGGWIRKFADGTHTWPIKNKLSIDPTNFSCLNFRSPLGDYNFTTNSAASIYSLPPSVAATVPVTKYNVSQTYQNEYDQLCRSPEFGGCLQIPFKDTSNFIVYTPERYYPGKNVDTTDDVYIVGGDTLLNLDSANYYWSRMDSSPSEDPHSSTSYTFKLNSDVPYTPLPFLNPQGMGLINGTSYSFIGDPDFAYGSAFYLPAYIGFGGKLTAGTVTTSGGVITNTESFIKKVYIKYFYESTSGNPVIKLEDITTKVATDIDCTADINWASPSGLPADGLVQSLADQTVSRWCVTYSSKTGNRPVFMVKANTNSSDATYKDWVYAGVVIDFEPIEEFQKKKTTTPGNPLYYLEKLGRLELLGIPQITYEPLYCNNDKDAIVPGILNSAITTRTSMSTNGYTYSFSSGTIEVYNADSSVNDTEHTSDADGVANYGNAERKFVYQNNVNHAAVFSSKDFTCCTELGNTPKNGTASCCSGYSVTKNSKTICALPTGTDINVYFNKFVSSEGVGSDLPGGGLISKLIQDTDGDGTNEYTETQAEDNIDFNPMTGEPKLRDSTYQKLYALGVAYCSSGTVGIGGAFGAFPPEPFGGTYSGSSGSTYTYPTSIVDSLIDTNTDATAGKIMFDQGFRWNHHYYCK